MDNIYWIERGWRDRSPKLRSCPVKKVTPLRVVTDRDGPHYRKQHNPKDVRFTAADAWAKYVGECADALANAEAAVESLKADLVAALQGRDATP